MILAILFAKDAVVIHIMMTGIIRQRYLNHLLYLLDCIISLNIHFSIGTTLNLTEINCHFKLKYMNAQQLFNLTSPTREMSSQIFEALMENARFERYSDTDYAFISKHGNYEINFGLIDGILDIDCFGFTHKTEWMELKPTDSQINAMKRKLDNVEPYQYEFRKEYQKNIMWENGHKPEDFY